MTLQIALDPEQHQMRHLEAIGALVAEFPGDLAIEIDLGQGRRLSLGWGVEDCPKFRETLGRIIADIEGTEESSCK